MFHSRNLGATVAPKPAHICELVTVICDELHAALFIGWGSRVAAQAEPSGMYVDRLDFKRLAPEDGCTAPEVVHAISRTALASVKDWAKDVGAFYNSHRRPDCRLVHSRLGSNQPRTGHRVTHGAHRRGAKVLRVD